MTPLDLSIRFFLQLVLVLAVCRLTARVFRYLGQSQVVSEMVAGVLMGPSLLGWLAPGVSDYLLPPQSKPILFAVAQVGIALYMFLVGMDFNVDLVRSRARSAFTVSFAGIAVPFALGAFIASCTLEDRLLFPQAISHLEGMMFLGAAMSITAFPMLARIVDEQRLRSTSLGTLVLAAGSLDDAAAWCILSVVLSSFAGDGRIALFAIGGGLLYVWVTTVYLRRALAPLGARTERTGTLDEGAFNLVLMLVLLGAFWTDFIQIYAVFGAFVMGTAMPRGQFSQQVAARIEPLTTSLLLPLFFVYSGLNTKLGLLDSRDLWVIAGVCFAAATLGKGGACYFAARFTGEPPRDAMAVGTLMNARGLMELIILNIGLERGLIAPALFAIMVLMAIGTTLMTTPLFRLVYRTKPATMPVSGLAPALE